MKQAIVQLIQLQLIVKLVHWKPTNAGQLGSGQEHEALGELYDYLNGAIDRLVETYQGREGLIDISIPATKHQDIISSINVVLNTLSNCDKADDCYGFILN